MHGDDRLQRFPTRYPAISSPGPQAPGERLQVGRSLIHIEKRLARPERVRGGRWASVCSRRFWLELLQAEGDAGGPRSCGHRQVAERTSAEACW